MGGVVACAMWVTGGLLSACLDKGVDITSLLQSRVMKMSIGDVFFCFFFYF